MKIPLLFFTIVFFIFLTDHQNSTQDTIQPILPKKDSLSLDKKIQQMQFYYNKRDWKKAHEIAHNIIFEAKKINHKKYQAKAENYLGSLYVNQSQYDSAYYYFYNAGKNYKSIGDSLKYGKTLLSMSIIEKNVSDFFTAMNTATKAEKLIRPYNDNRLLGSVYNNLGIASNELGRYEKAIEYHKKALEYRRKLKNPSIKLYVGSINNLAVVFRNQEKFSKAIEYLQNALKQKNIENYPKELATILDNLGYTYFLTNQKEKGRIYLNKALALREQHNNIPGKIVSFLHLSELEQETDIVQAKKMLDKAIYLSKTIGDTRDLITGYKLKALLENTSNKNALLNYIALKDSITKHQNVSSLRLNRIKYESDLLIQEKQNAIKLVSFKDGQLKNRNMIITMLFVIVSLILLLIYWIYKAYKYRIKLNKEFNHRVRNNLNHISYYVLKLKKYTSDLHLVERVKELDTVIQTQLLIHSILEKDNSSENIALDTYMETITNYIVISYSEFNVACDFDMGEIRVRPEKASVLAIIVHEFITNAFKHGFNKKSTNKIYISLKKDKNKILLQIQCSGVPWNPNSLDKTVSSGLLIMESLAKNMKSSINIYFDEKSILQLSIPSKIIS